jgi:TonB family protein
MKYTRNNCFAQVLLAKLVFTFALIALCLSAPGVANAGQGGSDPAPVHVGGDIKPPIKTKDAKPVYPQVARSTHTQGVVIMDVTIDEDGKVKSVKVLKSLPMLEAAAVDAVKKWEFKPTLVNGKPTPVIMAVAVNFKLD